MFSHGQTGLFVDGSFSTAKIQAPVFVHPIHIVHGKVSQGVQGFFHRDSIKDQFGGIVPYALDFAVVVDHLQGLPFHLPGNIPDNISYIGVLVGLPEHHILQSVIEAVAFVHELGVRRPFNGPTDDVAAIPWLSVSIQMDVDALHII